jgi:P-type conjugative transfer protein TrbJ
MRRLRPEARRLRFVVSLALALALASSPAPAQFPVTDVAHISVNAYWHLAHYVQFAEQILQQYYQILNQIRQIQYQLQALRKLQDPNWRSVAVLLQDLEYLTRLGKSLGYSLANLDGEFRNTFPGWEAWRTPDAPQQQAQRALDTMRAGLLAVRRQSQSFGESEGLLATIRDQMGRVQGHEQQLELLATLSSFHAQEALLTRQQLSVANNLAAVAAAYQIDRQAQADATYNLLVQQTSLAGFRNSSPGFTFQPPWWPFF